MKAAERLEKWIERHVISPIVRRIAAIATAQDKKTRAEIEKLRKEIRGDE